MEFITCPTPQCGFRLTRTHLRVVDRWGPQLALVEGACPRCGTAWGPIALPVAWWDRLPAGESEDAPRLEDERLAPITADEVLEFQQFLQRLHSLPADLELPTPDQILWFAHRAVREGVSPALMDELRRQLELRWPGVCLHAALEPLLQEATAAIQRQAEGRLRLSRLHALLGLLGIEVAREHQDFRGTVRHQLHTLFLFGLLLGLGASGELDELVAHWQEEHRKRGNA